MGNIIPYYSVDVITYPCPTLDAGIVNLCEKKRSRVTTTVHQKIVHTGVALLRCVGKYDLSYVICFIGIGGHHKIVSELAGIPGANFIYRK